MKKLVQQFTVFFLSIMTMGTALSDMKEMPTEVKNHYQLMDKKKSSGEKSPDYVELKQGEKDFLVICYSAGSEALQYAVDVWNKQKEGWKLIAHGERTITNARLAPESAEWKGEKVLLIRGKKNNVLFKGIWKEHKFLFIETGGGKSYKKI